MKKILIFIAIISSILVSLIGCAPKQSSSNSTDNGTQNKKVIKVGTMGTYEPFTYQDKDGKLTGFDIEVLRELENYMPSYTFEFIASPWDTLFVGLESDRFQLLANQLASNKTREEKYLITDNYYFNAVTQPIVRSDNDSIKSLSDLKGKKVGTTIGDSHTLALEKYNEDNGSLIDIVYYESDINSVLQDVVSGRIDATVNNPIVAEKKAELLGLNIKPVPDTLKYDSCYFITKKDEEGQKLKDELDTALTKIREDGTLTKISIDWFGVDYTE